MGTLHDDLSRFMTSRSVFRVRNVSDSSYRENGSAHFMFNNFFENFAFYEIMWKNMVDPDGPQMTT
jgi:hypothetical protein